MRRACCNQEQHESISKKCWHHSGHCTLVVCATCTVPRYEGGAQSVCSVWGAFMFDHFVQSCVLFPIFDFKHVLHDKEGFADCLHEDSPGGIARLADVPVVLQGELDEFGTERLDHLIDSRPVL
mmetsp:Transcript_7726/g.47937  ORF Transcript_7726/g.47937 Transcript_7726/m.47937 type:complete len:124 (+) Transcript_7726:485-856(+)